jgi:hypothetical protein
MTAPTPAEIRAAREASGLSGEAAAQLVGLGSRKRWSEYETGAATIDAIRWDYFLLRTGQHPEFRPLVRKRTPAHA